MAFHHGYELFLLLEHPFSSIHKFKKQRAYLFCDNYFYKFDLLIVFEHPFSSIHKFEKKMCIFL